MRVYEAHAAQLLILSFYEPCMSLIQRFFNSHSPILVMLS